MRASSAMMMGMLSSTSRTSRNRLSGASVRLQIRKPFTSIKPCSCVSKMALSTSAAFDQWTCILRFDVKVYILSTLLPSVEVEPISRAYNGLLNASHVRTFELISNPVKEACYFNSLQDRQTQMGHTKRRAITFKSRPIVGHLRLLKVLTLYLSWAAQQPYYCNISIVSIIQPKYSSCSHHQNSGCCKSLTAGRDREACAAPNSDPVSF